MKLFKITLLLLGLLSVSFSAEAQQENSLENQFTEVIEKSNRYQDYKVVKIFKLTQLKKSVLDSVSGLKSEIVQNQSTINDLQDSIASLESKVSTTEAALAESQKKEDGIYLFGKLLQKSTYNTLLWSIIGVMLLLTLYFLFRFRRSNTITKEANTKLAEIEEEFEGHRQRSLEREQQLRRKLQDEINKQKNTA